MNARSFDAGKGKTGMATAGLDMSELIQLALLLVAVGALSGFLAGVFGIGGGAILVPVFYECFRLAGVPLEVRMPLCIGTSLAIIIPTSIRSWRAHYLRGAVDTEILKAWWLPVLAGVITGSVTARYAPERLFKIVFVAVAWSAAARLLLARATWKFGDDLPKGPADESLRLLRRHPLHLDGHRRRIVFEPADDLLRPADPSGGRDLLGAGSPDLDSRGARLRLCRLARGRAFSRCRSAAMPFALGYVSLIGAVLVMPLSLLTAPLGVRAAHAMSKRTLEMAFGAYLFIVGSRFVISLV